MRFHLTDKKIEEVVKTQDFNGGRTYKVVDLGGMKIFVKFFKERGIAGFLRNFFSPRGKKEFQVHNKLVRLGVEVPECYGYGITFSGSFSVWRHIPGESYLKAFRKSEDRIILLKRLAHFLRHLKDKGIRHDDLHLENLIVHEDRLILVDLHKVKVKKKLEIGDEVSNLSHALNMIYHVLSENEKEAFFDFYGKPELKRVVERRLKILKERWIKKKMGRAFRESSVVSKGDGYIFIKGFEGIETGEFVREIKKDKKVEILKYANCIKKVYRGKGRLKKAWKNSVVLEYMGLGITPKVFALRLPNFFSSGFILMEDLSEKGKELDRYLDGDYGKMSYQDRRTFIRNFSTFFEKILNHGVFHKDLKGCNIFVKGGCEFCVLDIEDIEFKKVSKEEILSMLKKLNNTIPKKISLKERMRFLASLSQFSKKERNEIIKEVIESSKEEEIVYEGEDGLRRESWRN